MTSHSLCNTHVWWLLFTVHVFYRILKCGVTVDDWFLLLFRVFWCCCRTFPQSTGEMRRWASSWQKRTDWSTCLQMHPATTGDRPETVSQQNRNLHWTGTRWTSGAASGPDISWCVWGNLEGPSRLKVESVTLYFILWHMKVQYLQTSNCTHTHARTWTLWSVNGPTSVWAHPETSAHVVFYSQGEILPQIYWR